MSKWCRYLQSLPQECVPLAVFWEESEGDWQRCRACIRGSTLDYHLRSQEVTQRMVRRLNIGGPYFPGLTCKSVAGPPALLG